MVRPERRTRTDLVVVALIAVVVLVGAAALWWFSDARATLSETASPPLAAPPAAARVPATLTEAWRADSPATPVPVVAKPAVVTGAGNEVLGRDPLTGQVAWRYARDIPLCTVGEEWGRALAVYRKTGNCSEVTSLQGPTGVRGPQRNSDAEPGTELLTDGTYVTATGHRSFETWRSDLVRTQQFGVPVTPKNPGNNMARPDCTYASIAAGDDRIGMVENCPHEMGRITMIKAKPEDDEKPEEVFSVGLGDTSASVVAVTDRQVAVALRDSGQLAVFDTSGAQVARVPVRLGPREPSGNVSVEQTETRSGIFWFTGTDTVALNQDTLTPLWTLQDTLGPGMVYAGRVLVPVPSGLAVLDPTSGQQERVIPVDRGPYRGPVRLGTSGTVILEQRGNQLVALR